jgi:hypothetical protein
MQHVILDNAAITFLWGLGLIAPLLPLLIVLGMIKRARRNKDRGRARPESDSKGREHDRKT